jgi:hypothetical protein
MSYIKKREYFTKEQLLLHSKILNEKDSIDWHKQYTPWFSDEINIQIGKLYWEEKKKFLEFQKNNAEKAGNE